MKRLGTKTKKGKMEKPRTQQNGIKKIQPKVGCTNNFHSSSLL